MKKINPLHRHRENEKIRLFSEKLGIPELQLMYELGYEIKFTNARSFEIKDMANKARDLYNNEKVKGVGSKFAKTYFSLWFTFSAYYHLYSYKGTMLFSGISDLTEENIDAFSTGIIPEELQHLAYHGMIKLAETFEYALQVQSIIFRSKKGGPNLQRSIDKLLKQVKTFGQAIAAYEQISSQGDDHNSKIAYELVKKQMIIETEQATELIQFADIYQKKMALNIWEEINDHILKAWNNCALKKFNEAITFDHFKNVYENTHSKCDVKYLALKKMTKLIKSDK